jgi:hypothetical protein
MKCLNNEYMLNKAIQPLSPIASPGKTFRNCIDNKTEGEDHLTMGYYDNLDNELLNKYQKIKKNI